jgi:nucleotide-binding universal stress UspA family protein
MKVLLAIDDSTFSEAATQMIIQEMRPDSTEVRVVHAVPLSLPNEALKQAKGLVVRAEQVLGKAGFKASSEVLEGDPGAAVTHYAVRWHADLIVVGSHGRTGLQRLVMGSVAESIARHTHCSIEIVRPSAGRSQGQRTPRQQKGTMAL